MIYKDNPVHEEHRLSGLPVSPGVSVGKLLILAKTEIPISELTLAYEEVEYEINRYYKALRNSHSDIISLQQQAEKQRGGSEIISILKSHIDIIKDPIFTEDVVNAIRRRCKNAEYVFSSIIGEIEEKFINSEKSFFSERVQDIQDVSRRIIGYLCHQGKESFGSFNKNLIVFSKQISPSMAAEVNTSFIRALITEQGSDTSHTAIVCRAKGIPYVSGINLSTIVSSLQNSSSLPIIVDGTEGQVIVNPLPQTLDYYYKKSKTLSSRTFSLSRINSDKTLVDSGLENIKISANVNNVNQISQLRLLFPNTRIGLFRSEFLALEEKRFPNEETQFLIYRELAQHVPGSSVIRVFDLGADKMFSEENLNEDFSDYRAIRFLLKHEEIFKVQIRAILRATYFGCLRILLPFVSDLTELRRTKELIKEVKEELETEKKCVIEENISIGCMIEVPAAVMLIDSLAKECDFLSIGTNDLSQFVLGISRDKQKPDYLNNALHPSVIRMIKLVMKSACAHNVPVSICGEAAKEEDLLPVFLGMGITEISISPNHLNTVIDTVRNIDTKQAKLCAKEALLASTVAELQKCLKKFKTVTN